MRKLKIHGEYIYDLWTKQMDVKSCNSGRLCNHDVYYVGLLL